MSTKRTRSSLDVLAKRPRCGCMELTMAAPPEQWLSTVASLFIVPNRCKPDGLPPILEYLNGMKGQRLNYCLDATLKTSMAIGGSISIELKVYSVRLLPGSPSPPSPSRSIGSGLKSTKKSPKRKSSSKSMIPSQVKSQQAELKRLSAIYRGRRTALSSHTKTP